MSNRPLSLRAALVATLGLIAMSMTPNVASGAKTVAGSLCDLCTNSCATSPAQRCSDNGCGDDAESCLPSGCEGVDGNSYEYRIDCIW